LIQEDVDEAEFLPRGRNKRIPQEVKNAIIDYVINKQGTETAAPQNF
jgi:hypothetical protein